MMFQKIIFLLLCCLSLNTTQAQDSLSQQTTTPKSVVLKPRFEPDAKKAGLYSALIPGMGQIYNRQYWKASIIYVGLGVATYFIIKNNNDYNRYRKAYVSRLSNNPNSTDEFKGILSTEAIKQYQDDSKKYLDMTVLFTVIGYAGQVMEAIAAAHLHNFDVSKDVSLHISPIVTPNQTIGMSLVMNF
jgi:hypothetical protein